MDENEHENGGNSQVVEQIVGLMRTVNLQHHRELENAMLRLGWARMYDPNDDDDDDDDSSNVPSSDGDGNSSEGGYGLEIIDIRDLVLHDPINLLENQHHIGPLPDPVTLQPHVCDCALFNGNENICLLANRNENWLNIDFDDELANAVSFEEDNEHREPNNLQRKRLYRAILENLGRYIEFDYNEETGRYARTPLPNCACALVRMIWPFQTGRYMGFRLY